MIKFEELSEHTVHALKAAGIEEKDLFNHESDLYIGCKDIATANILKRHLHPMAGNFIPQKGSDMDHYPIAIDLAFGYSDGFYKKKYANRIKHGKG